MFDDLDEDLIAEENAAGSDQGLPEPRLMADWHGDPEIEKRLLDLTMSGRMPHALIFAGPEGIGKATMTFRLTRFLFCQKDTEEEGAGLFGDDLPAAKPENLFIPHDDPVFEKVASGGHPDLLVIERQIDEAKGRLRTNIDVKEARRVVPFLRMKAARGGWRIVIIDDADTMNRNAQNAILKILEEPPDHTLLVLIAHRAGALIPTIRSRCQVVTFPVLSYSPFVKLLHMENAAISGHETTILYNMSRGSVGQSLRIHEEGGLEAIDKTIALLSGFPKWDWPQIHAQADNLSRKGQEESYKAFRHVLLWSVEQLVRARALNKEPVPPLDTDGLKPLLKYFDLAQWTEICEKLKDHFQVIENANLDKRQAVIGAFSILGDTQQEIRKYG